jgi:signal peptidase II
MTKIKFIFIIILLAILDLLTKYAAFSYVENYVINNNLPFFQVPITDFFNLVIVWNKGVSFGMFSDINYAKYFIFIINIAIITYLFFWLYKNKKKYIDFALSFILAGAFGNLIDRAINGAVADFLDFHLFNYHWPAFNLADSLVFIGVFMLIFENQFTKNNDKNSKKKNNKI